MDLGTGFSTAGCPVCKQVFTSTYYFDRHRDKGKCLDPEALGYEQNARGQWKKPQGENIWKK